MSLLKRFIDYIHHEHLFTAKDRLLLAVSGGIDSAVLCELCYQGGYDFVMAHCNFRLRGEESERDEQFVRDLGKKYGKEVLVKQFDTEAYAAARKVSIQVAARELRYAWFEEIASGVIVTAHHLDDNIETVLMKFFKGTGIAGMRGILPRQGKVVRPLLFAKKEELAQFAADHQLPWVEDSSNAQDKYARNYLRHQVVPLLQKLYPEVVNNLAANIARFREVEELYHQAVEAHQKKLLEYKGSEVHIPVLKLKKAAPLSTLVYEITKGYGFTAAQTADIIHLLDSESGRYVASGTHRIIRNRNWLIIAPVRTEAVNHIIIEKEDTLVQFSMGSLLFKNVSLKGSPFPAHHSPLTTDNSIACIDSKHLHYPLLLRRWKAGDYFYPLGMKKKKKVARFLIDSKLSQTDKEKVWVLESNKKILWVVGMRIDDRCKVDHGTTAILQVEFKTGANNL